jgi:predicted dehydrogenase
MVGMTGEQLRVGIVGCGKIARQHLAGYRSTPSVKVTTVYDISESASAEFAELAEAEVAASIEDMIARPVDAVSVCTPPGVHLENCLPFLEAKVPILCEKPLEANATTAAQLAAAVRQSGTIFMVGFCHRFHPPILEIKNLIDNGVLGAPVLFRNIFGGYRDIRLDHRAKPELAGGGTMIDNGSHSVDLFRFLVGDPTQVSCRIGNAVQEIPVEDLSVILLSSGDRAFGVITSSNATVVGSSQVAWYGTKGTAILDYPADLSYKLAGEEWIQVDCPPVPSRFDRETRHFVECVREHKTPLVTVNDGLKASVIISAAYQAAERGETIQVGLP